MADWLADRLLGAPARVRLTRTMLLAAAVVVITWILAVREDVYAWEIDVTEWVLDLPSWTEPVLRASMQSGNRLAVAALALLFLIVDRPRRAAVVLLAGWGAWLACVGAKAVVGRPRPTADVLGFSPEEFAGGNGYPSSHTAVAVALALVIVTTTGVPRVLKG
ncbi:MAG: phosphatase PAP2 family protein, partial [Actinomycetota bacterium]